MRRPLSESQLGFLQSKGIQVAKGALPTKKDELRENQENLIVFFSDATFKKYLKPLLPWVFNQIIELLQERPIRQGIAEQIATKIAPTPSLQASPQKEAKSKLSTKEVQEANFRLFKRTFFCKSLLPAHPFFRNCER